MEQRNGTYISLMHATLTTNAYIRYVVAPLSG